MARILGLVFVIVVELGELYNIEVTCNSVKSWRNGGPPPEKLKKIGFFNFSAKAAGNLRFRLRRSRSLYLRFRVYIPHIPAKEKSLLVRL